MWKRLLKYVAGKAFVWGLKKLTELAPEEIKSTPPRVVRRHRKPYAH